MALKFANNAFSTLASSITAGTTSLVVQAGQGARFPTVVSPDYSYVTLVDLVGNYEICKVTARSADTLTVLRAQEGTTARAFAAGSYIANQTTAAQLASFFNLDNDGPSSGLDADLLDGFQSSQTVVASTIPVRDANGRLPGDITGNATTATEAAAATTATNVSGGSASVTTLTASGAANLQANVTLGSSPNNNHTINGGTTQSASARIGTAQPGGGTDILGAAIELAAGTTVDTASFVDFHARAGSDFDARIIRAAGVNGILQIQQLGSGGVEIAAPSGTLDLLNFNLRNLVGVGYQRFPGGLLIQWGNMSVPQDGTVTVTFPIAFTDSPFHVFAQNIQSLNGAFTNGSRVGGMTATNFSFSHRDTASLYSFVAIGF